MTPLSTKEQWILACLLGIFVAGSGLLVAQSKILDRQLAGVEQKSEVRSQTAEGRRQKTEGGSQKKDVVLSLARATAEELEELPGIGPKLAQDIVQYRQDHPFQSPEDLQKVPGIGPKRWERIKDRVKVD